MNLKIINPISGLNDLQVVFNKNKTRVSLINSKTKKTIWHAPLHCRISSVLLTSLPNFVLIGMENKFNLINSSGTVMEYISDFPVDGYYFTKQNGGIVEGYIESEINLNEEVIRFEFFLDDMKLKIDY